MEQIRSSGLEEQLAYHTAPVLMGIKPAGLFSVGQALGDTWKQIRAFHQKMASSGLHIRILCSCKKRLLLFVYQEQRLEAALSPSIRTLLRKKFGYRQTQSLDAMLSELAEHIQQSATFPHEIGLFLGYPVADVLGFIAHHGEDYLLLGYWKVYRNAEQAKQLFSQYDGCRSYLCRQMKQGRSFYQALQVAEKSSNAF